MAHGERQTSRMGNHRSPFDPYLYTFLEYVQHHAATFSPTSPRSLARAAEELEMQPALVEALFASAGGRGLLRPARAPGGRSRWEVSRKGREFMTAYARAGEGS